MYYTRQTLSTFQSYNNYNTTYNIGFFLKLLISRIYACNGLFSRYAFYNNYAAVSRFQADLFVASLWIVLAFVLQALVVFLAK